MRALRKSTFLLRLNSRGLGYAASSPQWNERKAKMDKRLNEKKRDLERTSSVDLVADHLDAVNSVQTDLSKSEKETIERRASNWDLKPAAKKTPKKISKAEKDIAARKKIKSLVASKLVLNEDVPHESFMLLDDEDEELGVMSKEDALKLLRKTRYKKKSMSFTVHDASVDPVVCKMMTKSDVDKTVSEIKQKVNPKPAGRKELLMTNRIASNDQNLKLGRAKEWLAKRHSVTLTIKFKEASDGDLLSEAEAKAKEETEMYTSSRAFINKINALNLPQWQADRVFRQRKRQHLSRTVLKMFTDNLREELETFCSINSVDYIANAVHIQLQYSKQKSQ